MARAWYSKKLHVESYDALLPLVAGFVRPLIRSLDRTKAKFQFHFFRYSIPSSFLRLRIRGNKSVLHRIEKYELANLPKFGARSELEPYQLSDALAGPFRDADEVEKAWYLFELASRLSMENAVQGFSAKRLRD